MNLRILSSFKIKVSHKITREFHFISDKIDCINKQFPLTLFRTNTQYAPLSAQVPVQVQSRLLLHTSWSCIENMTKFNPVTHVIFDMDGLLLDTQKIYSESIHEICKSHNKELTWELNERCMGLTSPDSSKIIVSALELPISPEEFFTAARKICHASFLKSTDFMPGAERLVRHLHKHNIPIAVATSSGQDSVIIKTKQHKELFSLFHHMVMANSDKEVKNGKPSPDIFLICGARFPTKPAPKECLVFEDAPNGVTAGIAAGMQTVMVPDPLTPPDKRKHATLVLDSLNDFKPELFGLPPF